MKSRESMLPSSSSSSSKRPWRSSKTAHQGRVWLAALACASIWASQENRQISVLAFQAVGGPGLSRRQTQLSAATTVTSTAAVTEESVSPSVSSRMFLKAGQASLQPTMSSLSSDFFDTPTTRPRSIVDGEGNAVLPVVKRSQGILGFALQEDLGDHIISSSKTPPPMDDSSTVLHSSTADHQQDQDQVSYRVDTWGSTRKPFVGEEWTIDSNGNTGLSSNPILNRSPNTAATNTDDQASPTTAAPAWFPWMPSNTQIRALKVRELRSICADRGLKQSGNKVELQQRLWEWTRAQQHRQRRLMIGSNSENSGGTLFRLERKDKTNKETPVVDNVDANTKKLLTEAANALDDEAQTYDIEKLLQRREKIHKEKRQGKTVIKPGSKFRKGRKGPPNNPSKEYLSKLFDAPSSQYSNLEVKQMYAGAKAADQNGDRVLSKQILLKLKDATPHDARIYRRLARMEMEEGNLHSGRKILQEGLRSHPSNAYLWHGLGQLELKAGDDQETRKCFMKAIQLEPAFPNAYHALGTMEHSRGHIAKAMKVLKAGLLYCPTNHRLHHALGDLYREAKMLDMAERSYRRALEHGREVSKGFAYTSLAHVAYERGQVSSCRSFLKKALELNDGRHAKGWLNLAHLEESEGNIDAARSVCITALNRYEKQLLRRAKKGLSHNSSKARSGKANDMMASLTTDPVKLKNEMLRSVPKYRSGDHFLKLYRDWARIEKVHGTLGTVDEVYTRATIAFPLEWKLSLDWAEYHVKQGHPDRARQLFTKACEKVSNRHADPYRQYAEFEMRLGRYSKARQILYHGAVAMSDASDGGLGNHAGLAELYFVWAVCEWHMNNLSRAEILFDHAMRLSDPGEGGSAIRSYILYSIALLEYERGEHHLAQHCICLCLKENAMPGGNSKAWDLWGRLAEEMGEENLAEECSAQSIANTAKEGTTVDSLRAIARPGLSTLKEGDMQKLMRKDPWHYKIFNVEGLNNSPLLGVVLPER